MSITRVGRADRAGPYVSERRPAWEGRPVDRPQSLIHANPVGLVTAALIHVHIRLVVLRERLPVRHLDLWQSILVHYIVLLDQPVLVQYERCHRIHLIYRQRPW